MGCKLSQDLGVMHNPSPKTFSHFPGRYQTPKSNLGQPGIVVLTPKKWSQGWGCADQYHILGCPVQDQQSGFADPSGYSTVLCPTKAWKWAKLGELGILCSVCIGDTIWPSDP